MKLEKTIGKFILKSGGLIKKIMKKLFVLFLIFGLVSCGVSRPKGEDGKEADVLLSGSATYYSVCVFDYKVSGMHYKVFNSANGNIFVINVTKDSLDVCRKDSLNCKMKCK